ncbi:MAG: ComF family protein [Patescibacteria group bacterium]
MFISLNNTTKELHARLTRLWNIFLDALFPCFCLACKQDGRGWCCDKCWLDLTFSRSLYCPDCAKPSILGKFCDTCQSGHFLTGLWVSQPYSQPTVRAIIHGLKYQGITEVAPRLADILTITLQTFALPPAWHPTPRWEWILTPVPLTAKRQRIRGFNQAELIAKLVSKQVNLPLDYYLRRTTFRKAQVDLKNNQRRDNVVGAFKLKPEAELSGKTIILVDDVYTSGSTMEECAKILKTAGTHEVWGLVVAKG